jgi:hypothetical protein
LLAGTVIQGCIFDPDCENYEQCVAIEPVPANTSNGAANASPNATSNNTSTTPENNAGDRMLCDLDSCPDEPAFEFGTSPSSPVGCQAFGETELFEFIDESEVCAGSPRSYGLWVQSCDASYIIEVDVEVLGMCSNRANLDFDFEGFGCNEENTRCSSTDTTARAQFLIERDSALEGYLEFRVRGESGGFPYRVTVSSRR